MKQMRLVHESLRSRISLFVIVERLNKRFIQTLTKFAVNVAEQPRCFILKRAISIHSIVTRQYFINVFITNSKVLTKFSLYQLQGFKT